MIFKMAKLSLATIAATMLISTTSQAREFADIYTDCGLGALIAPKSDAVAAVTNVTWDLGTTAISSNISSEDTCKGGQARVAAFINDSYENIEKDIVKGEGKYLDKLVQLSNANVSELRLKLSESMANNDYSTLTTYEKSEKLYNSIY